MSQRDSNADATHLYQPGDFIALEMGRLAAQRVNPQTLQEFKRQLEKMWFEIVHRGPAAVRQAFTETSERGQVLRSSISFSAFMTKIERDSIFRERTKDGVGR
jgi:hypothetical protein